METTHNREKKRFELCDDDGRVMGFLEYTLGEGSQLRAEHTVVSKKYEELTKRIKESTAERLKAQGLEDLNIKKAEKDKQALDDFMDNIGGIRNYETRSGYLIDASEVNSYTYRGVNIEDEDAKKYYSEGAEFSRWIAELAIPIRDEDGNLTR